MTESISISVQIKDLIIIILAIFGIFGLSFHTTTKRGIEIYLNLPAIAILIIEIIYIFKVY